LSKRNVEKLIDAVMNKTSRHVVKEPVKKENCSYFRDILLKRKRIARELALLLTNFDGLTGSTAQSFEKLILRDVSCKLGLECRKGNRVFCSIHREVNVGIFVEESAKAC